MILLFDTWMSTLLAACIILVSGIIYGANHPSTRNDNLVSYAFIYVAANLDLLVLIVLFDGLVNWRIL